jgi:hypothetical protein
MIRRPRGAVICFHPCDMCDREPHRQPLLDPKPLLRGLATRRNASGGFGAGASRSREVMEGSDMAVSRKQKGDKEF